MKNENNGSVGRLEIETDTPKIIAESIKPDNLENIQTHITGEGEDGKVIIEFSFDNTRQSIASLDDILKCVDVAREVDSLCR